MTVMKFFLLILSFTFLVPLAGHAQIDTTKVKSYTREEILKMTYDDLLTMPFDQLVLLARKMGVSIDQLLKMKTSVASKTELTPRETPGIISIITEEEIRTSGARDLIDVLRLVPGINFGYDVQGVVGLQMRGNWAHEGKILLMIDGIEFNELKYNSNQFGRHFDVAKIKKIEIIRGPGSSIYGGDAELGVINITTKSADEVNGINIYSSAGVMANALGHIDGGINFGKKINTWNIDFKGFYSDGNRTDQLYQANYKIGVFDLSKGGAKTGDLNFNLGIKHKNLAARILYDAYSNDGFHDTVTYQKYYFKTLSGDIKYDLKIGDKFVLTPKFNFRNNLPYYEDGFYKNSSLDRYTGNLTFHYDPVNMVNIIGGAEFYYDYGKPYENTDSLIFNGKRTITYNNYSFFLQGIIKTKLLNIIIGGRFDDHSQFGTAFAPRIGLTRSWDNFHIKALYSQAFRSPSIGNLVFNPAIKPERTTVAELELGYKLNNNMFITANLFNIIIKDPIIFTGITYKNYDKTGTSGFEIEYKIKYIWGSATLNYSYYKTNSTPLTYYKVLDHDNLLLGAPASKISLLSNFNISKHFYISPSLDYIGKRYYPTYGEDNTGKTIIGNKVTNADLLVNLFINYKNLIARNLNVGLGVYDLLNSKSAFYQPYYGFQNPLPGPSREFVLRLVYNLGFKN